MNLIGFVVFGALAIVSAIVVISRTNPVVSALALAFNLVSIAGFYLLLGTQFIALLQVIVYAGAIMVLVLFVIMLLNLPDHTRGVATGFLQRWLAPVLALIFTGVMGWALKESGEGSEFGEVAAGFGAVDGLGQALFTRFFYAFEALSLLLVVAMVGAVLLAKRRL